MAAKKAREQPSYSYELSSIIWSNVRRYQYLLRISDETLADMMGVCTRTLSAYDKTPSVLTLEKIQRFVTETGLDAENLLKI